MADCAKNCSSCHGCACSATIYLSQDEVLLLQLLGEFAFLPMGRNAEKKYVIREPETQSIQDVHTTVRHMVKEGYLSAELQHPLAGFTYNAYDDCTEKGSIGLTLRGQRLVEYLDIIPLEETPI